MIARTASIQKTIKKCKPRISATALPLWCTDHLPFTDLHVFKIAIHQNNMGVTAPDLPGRVETGRLCVAV